MENKEQVKEPKKKINDFILTFLWIAGLIGGLLLLKYLMSAMHVL